MQMDYQNVRDYIFSGAFHGMFAWMVYAVVECWFSSILPWIIQPHYLYQPLHWGFTALLFAFYPIFGLILGGFSGLGLRLLAVRIPLLKKAQHTKIFPAMVTFTIILVFSINLIVQCSPKSTSVLLFLLISFLLTMTLALSALSSNWASRLSFLINPWTTCILLVGLSWINTELSSDHHTRGIKGSVTLLYIVTILLVSYFVKKILATYRKNRSTVPLSVYPIKNLVFHILVAFIVLAMSFFGEQEPHGKESNSVSSLQGSDLPNILLIVMDAVRADHLSLYGYERDTTPNLKKLSEEATFYNLAIASSDWTLPVHASIFTGMYTSRHSAQYSSRFPFGQPLSEKFQTLAEVLSAKGYLTIGVVANYGVLGYGHNMYQGFQYYNARLPTPFLAKIQPYYLRQAIRNVLAHVASPSTYELVYCRAEDINREVFSLLDKVHETGKHFFIFINYMDAHEPYIPPSPFDTIYPGKDETFTRARYSSLFGDVIALKCTVTEEQQNHLLSQYDGEIAYLDFHLGKLIARLKERSLYENCLIIITSDHGEVFGERDFMGHGMSVYQDQVHIPLLIKHPNIRQKVMVDRVVSVVDIMPTILDVLDYEIPIGVQGQSLLQLEPEKSRIVICESVPSSVARRVHPTRFRRVERAIFSGSLKFISSTAGKRELYDLSNDPNEKKNLYKPDDNKSMELEARLNEWLKTTPAESDSAAKLDKQTLDRLKSLGYIK